MKETEGEGRRVVAWGEGEEGRGGEGAIKKRRRGEQRRKGERRKRRRGGEGGERRRGRG